MFYYDYDINTGPGAWEDPLKVNEAVSKLPENKTLIIQQFTDAPPLTPEIVPDLKTTSDVFSYYKPQKEIAFETLDGSSVDEVLSFSALADFGKKGIIKQSKYVNELNAQNEDLQKFEMQLKSNKIFKTLLENPEAKASYVSILQGILNQLEQAQ